MMVRSILSAMAILRFLARKGGQPQSLSQISRGVELSMSSCFNVLKTLVHEDLLSFDPRTKKYALEALAAQFFAAAPRVDTWTQGLGDHLRGIASHHRVSCGLWQIRGDRQLLLEIFDSPSATRVHLGLGQRIPLYAGATGRSVAAIQRKSRRAISNIIDALRWQLRPTLDEYEASIRHAQEHGWSLDRNNHVCGLTSVSAPIRASERAVRYSITATGFSGQHDEEGLADIGKTLADIAKRAEQHWIEIVASMSSH
jgi:DNA-binding IclR family transcriptional regulator